MCLAMASYHLLPISVMSSSVTLLRSTFVINLSVIGKYNYVTAHSVVNDQYNAYHCLFY